MHGGGSLTFIDADDWIPPKSIELLLRKMAESNADFVCGNYTSASIPGFDKFNMIWQDSVFEMTDREKFEQFLPPAFMTPWAKLYKNDILKRSGIRFPIGMSVSEDTDFILRYLKYCDRVATLSSNTYYWSTLPKQSLSRRYYDDLGKCHALNAELRLGFFEKERLPIKEQISIILIFFYYTIVQYAEWTDSRALAIQKIAETHKFFREILVYLHKEQLLEADKGGGVENFYRYKPLFDEGRYEEIYDLLKERMRHERRTKAGIRKRIADKMRPFLCFLIYRLNLFYH